MEVSEKLNKKERHELILSEIRTSASIRISQLAKRIGVAGETIRRDLIELGEAGLLNRTYGGATISLQTSEPMIGDRGTMLIEERTRIARVAADLITSGQVVMLDGGSTTYEVARSLAQLRRDLTVITNSTGIANVTGGNPTFRVILAPGTFDRREGSVFGEDTVQFLGRYNADVAIFGASGLTPNGPCDAIPGSAAVKRTMISRALTSMLVIDGTKFGRVNLEHVCSFDAVADLVTDQTPPEDLAAALATAGTEIHVA